MYTREQTEGETAPLVDVTDIRREEKKEGVRGRSRHVVNLIHRSRTTYRKRCGNVETANKVSTRCSIYPRRLGVTAAEVFPCKSPFVLRTAPRCSYSHVRRVFAVHYKGVLIHTLDRNSDVTISLLLKAELY